MWERERGGVEQNVVRSQFASIYGEQPRNERIKIKTSNYPPTSWMSATLNYLVLLYDYADCVHAFSQCLYPLCSLIQFACVGHCLDGDAPDYNLVMLVMPLFRLLGWLKALATVTNDGDDHDQNARLVWRHRNRKPRIYATRMNHNTWESSI